MVWCEVLSNPQAVFDASGARVEEREKERTANTVLMKGKHVRHCRAVQLHFYQSVRANWSQPGAAELTFALRVQM